MQSIAIIGSGPTAIYAAYYLLQQEHALSIVMFEKQMEAGKGTPYHPDWNAKEMLSNIASIEIPPISSTLEDWLHARSDAELSNLGINRGEINERAFFPRVALGEYFQAQLLSLVSIAKKNGSNLQVMTGHKVLDIAVSEQEVDLTVREEDSSISHWFFDHVIMATGHVWPKQTQVKPGYFLSPWPAKSLKSIGNCHVGIRGTSLSAIDALIALCAVRGSFRRDRAGVLHYKPKPGTDAFHITMMSRKGLLPEADFYHPIPYEPLAFCTKKAIDYLIATLPRTELLNATYALFVKELTLCDPDYAAKIRLSDLSLEAFSEAYFRERVEHDPFVWAALNLKEAKENYENAHTVAWRYAILRMHEIVARIAPHLLAEDHQRFSRYFKTIFIDDYATVPHESIERLLAIDKAGKLSILRLENDYHIDTETCESGAIVLKDKDAMHFPAFIEATGQRALSIHEFPFPSLWQQGIIRKATARTRKGETKPIGGIALDEYYHPSSSVPGASRLYCLSIPFMLGQYPFAQGITSSHDMGKRAAQDLLKRIFKNNETHNAA